MRQKKTYKITTKYKKFKDKLKKTKLYEKILKIIDIYYKWEDSFVYDEKIYDYYHRFVYYEKSKQKFYYAAKQIDFNKIKKDFKLRRKILIAWIIIAFLLIRVSLCIPHKLSPDINNFIFINDKLDVISEYDEKIIKNSLEKFKKRTGIVSSFITLYDGDYFHSYHSLDSYIMDVYEKELNNNSTLLIVYSTNKNALYNRGKINLYMGKNVGKLIKPELKENLNYKLNSYISKEGYFPIKTCIEETLKEYFWKIMIVRIRFLSLLILTPIISVLIVLYFYDSYYKYKNYEKYKDSTLCDIDDDKLLTGVCLNCLKDYVFDVHRKCPHCGIVIPTSLELEEKEFHNKV